MEYKVNKEVKIVLELTQDEFNTIVCTFGASTMENRERVKSDIGLTNKMNVDEQADFYQELRKIATGI